MQCPICLGTKCRHIKTKHYTDAVGDSYTVRRRECKQCGHRYSTYECYEKADVELIFKMREAEAHILQGDIGGAVSILIDSE